MAVNHRPGLTLYWPGDDLQCQFICRGTCLWRCIILLSATIAVGSYGCRRHVGNDARRLSSMAQALAIRDAGYSAIADHCLEVWTYSLWCIALVSLWLVFLVSTE